MTKTFYAREIVDLSNIWTNLLSSFRARLPSSTRKKNFVHFSERFAFLEVNSAVSHRPRENYNARLGFSPCPSRPSVRSSASYHAFSLFSLSSTLRGTVSKPHHLSVPLCWAEFYKQSFTVSAIDL